jgi:hypothetical protein
MNILTTNKNGLLICFLFCIFVAGPSSAFAVLQNTSDQGSLSQQQSRYAPGEVLVKFKKGASEGRKMQAHVQAGTEVIKVLKEIGWHHVRSKRGESTEVLLERYRNSPDVEYVEPNIQYHLYTTPNDPKFSLQWGLTKIGAPRAWDAQTGNSSVTIAIIDSGVDYTHPDLAANMWINSGEVVSNGLDDDNNGYIDDIRGWNFFNNNNDPMDDNGHGTHVAGVAAAVGNNGIGIAGVSWQAKIMALKICGASGFCSLDSAASAVLYAVNKGAKVINNSYGGLGENFRSMALEDAIKYAYSNGVLFIAAAGNDTTADNSAQNNNDVTPVYPCNYKLPNVICVANSDENDNIAPRSYYGPKSVHIAAPGQNILSTVPTGICAFCDPSGYNMLSGTSMAAPFVSGAAALVMSQSPNLTIDRVKTALLYNVDRLADVDPLAVPTCRTRTNGRLNLANALDPTGLARQWVNRSSITHVGMAIANDACGNSYVAANGGDGKQFSTIKYNTDGNLLWQQNYGSADIRRLSIVVDDKANVYVATKTLGQVCSQLNIIDNDFVTLKYDTFGSLLWNVTYDYLGCNQVLSGDIPRALAVDKLGNVYVTGMNSTNISPWYPTDLVTMKYDSFGNQLWVARYQYGDAGDIQALTVDDAGNVYVTGQSLAPGGAYPDALTIKYDALGNQLWAARIPNAQGYAINIDHFGNSHIIGTEYVNGNAYNMIAVKYDSFGNQVWKTTYVNAISDYSIAVDYLGNVYISGISTLDYSTNVTIKYDPDGNQLWVAKHTNLYAGSVLAIDDSGSVYVAGQSFNGINKDYKVSKHTAAGQQLWNVSYDTGADDFLQQMSIDGRGNIYLTGAGGGSYPNADFLTVKFSQLGGGSDDITPPMVTATPSGGAYNSVQSVTLAASELATIHYTIDGSQPNMNSTQYSDLIPISRSTTLKFIGADIAGNQSAMLTEIYTINGPDLVMNQVSPNAATVNAGSALPVTNAVQNQGNQSAGSFAVGFSLSLNSTYGDADDVPIATTRSVKSLAASSTNTVTTNLAIPGTTIGGSYFVCSKADTGNAVSETDETNNTLCSSTQVTVPNADLIMTALTPKSTSVTRGSSFSLSNTVKNQGSGGSPAFVIQFVLTSNSIIGDADDILLVPQRIVNGLPVGGSSAATTTITVPASTPPGTYYVGAIADWTNAVTESNESNNTIMATKKIAVK